VGLKKEEGSTGRRTIGSGYQLPKEGRKEKQMLRSKKKEEGH